MVRDPAVHRRVLQEVVGAASELGLVLYGLIPSPLLGPAGNREFLGWWRPGGEGVDLEHVIAACLQEETG